MRGWNMPRPGSGREVSPAQRLGNFCEDLFIERREHHVPALTATFELEVPLAVEVRLGNRQAPVTVERGFERVAQPYLVRSGHVAQAVSDRHRTGSGGGEE